MTCPCSEKNSKIQLLHNICEVSFAVNDILLFLDTHPCHREAIAYYREMAGKRNALMAEYAKNYGPLTVDDAILSNADTWQWMEQPFPWEMEGGHR